MISELCLYDFYFPFFTIESKISKFFYHLSLAKITEVTTFDPASFILRQMKSQAVEFLPVIQQSFYAVNSLFCRAIINLRLIRFWVIQCHENMAGANGIRKGFDIHDPGQYKIGSVKIWTYNSAG